MPSRRKPIIVTCANVQKGQQQKYGKLPAKLAEKIPQNKPCVDLMGTYKIGRKIKYPLILKSITMSYPGTRWFGVMKYNNNKAMTISNLLETKWLSRYTCPIEITYDQGSEFIGREFKIPLQNTDVI